MFASYQEHRSELQQQKGHAAEDKQMDERVSQLIAAHQSGKSSETLKKLGKFLSTPLDDSRYQSSTAVENAAGTVLNIIIALLRVFVFKV